MSKPRNLNLDEESDLNLLLGELSSTNLFSEKNIYIIQHQVLKEIVMII